MDRNAKLKQIEQFREQIEQLEYELREEPLTPWQATGYYTAYYANNGFMLGMFAAISSLLFNVVGATVFGLHPLQLIRVYLTFPLGEEALSLESGLTLAIGCCLYIFTGALTSPNEMLPDQMARGMGAPYRMSSLVKRPCGPARSAR